MGVDKKRGHADSPITGHHLSIATTAANEWSRSSGERKIPS